MSAQMPTQWLAGTLVVALGACTSPPATSPDSGAVSSTATVTEAPPPELSRDELIESLLTAGLADPRVVIALADGPSGWVTGGHGHVLFVYHVDIPASLWRSGGADVGLAAWRLYDGRGRVVSQGPLEGSETDSAPLGYHGGFIVADRAHIDVDGRVSPVEWTRHPRTARRGDIFFDGPYGDIVYSPASRTIGPELPPSGCGGPYRRDERRRIWCLNSDGSVLSWSDDGHTWAVHRLSKPYADGAVDGVSPPAVSGDLVAVALDTVDISFDRGRTWLVIDIRDVFARMEPWGRHTYLGVFGDGRLLTAGERGYWLADDSTNRTFSKVSLPKRARLIGEPNGVFVARLEGVGTPAGTRTIASYDEGRSWVSLEETEFVRRIP